MTTARDAIIELLREARAPGTFATQRTAPADDLYVEVKGVGPLGFPVSRTQAQRLCRIARPARYGKGEHTLLDTRVDSSSCRTRIPRRAARWSGRSW